MGSSLLAHTIIDQLAIFVIKYLADRSQLPRLTSAHCLRAATQRQSAETLTSILASDIILSLTSTQPVGSGEMMTSVATSHISHQQPVGVGQPVLFGLVTFIFKKNSDSVPFGASKQLFILTIYTLVDRFEAQVCVSVLPSLNEEPCLS